MQHTITIAPERCTERTIPITADSTVELVSYTPANSANEYAALLVDGRHYDLVMAKFIHGRPEIAAALAQALADVQAAIDSLRTPAAAALDACPFSVGARVLRKSAAIAYSGGLKDASVGVVKRVYTVAKTTRTAHTFVVKLSVDWPAPRRIGGDGWHRSDVLASAVTPATDEEIGRRRAINRAIVARRGY